MSRFANFTLYSPASLDPLTMPKGLAANHWPGTFPAGWSMQLTRLEGGRRDGVLLLHVDNGLMSFDVLPTRGMGLWRGRLGALRLGWDSPVKGPVHPAFVNQADRSGLGWLDGFDEWLVRCGLSSLGPPLTDPLSGGALPLHGRIANQPAHQLEVRIQLDPPFALQVIGYVQETTMFFSGWELKTTYTTWPGANKLLVEDEVTHRRSQAAELFLLYHINLGPPLFQDGSRIRLPQTEIRPRDAAAAAGLDQWDACTGPTAGFAEQVFYAQPPGDEAGRSWALLHDPTRRYGLRLRWPRAELPCFSWWKNSAPASDGYVCGLEPGTCFPNPRPVEQEAGRAVKVEPGATWKCSVEMEAFDQGVPTDDWLI